MIQFLIHHPENKVQIGILVCENLSATLPNSELETRLKNCLDLRNGKELNADEERVRQAARDMLRYKSYKPTGRSKPASEYLFRTAQEGNFPRINTLVDINNYISMKYVLPISVWDIDKSATEEFLFRPGKETEEYVFNPTGQTIGIQDLMCGFRVLNGKEEAIVNPVKDSMLTKTDDLTSQVAVAIYFPAELNSIEILENALEEFAELFKLSGGKIQQKQILK